jgi:ribonuclease H2 subunit A
MGFVLRVLDASEISRNMLRNEPYNLNAMSHDAAIQMIQAVLDAGVKIDTAYIDTVGIADSYRQKLEREFSGHNIKFIVEKKADANYPPCSAASVVAKVSRDSILENWTYSEPEYEAGNNNKYGSGYPSDPMCKEWMEANLLDPVFCFPDIVRFSWAPVKNTIKEKGVGVRFKADDDDEEQSNTNQMKMNMLLQNIVKKDGVQVAVGPKKKRRFEYFDRAKIRVVSELVKM